MAKYSEYEQREILGSRQKLEEFKRGEDIEKIFNRLRPKYPIRKYVEVVGYNPKMELKRLLAEIKQKKKHTKNRVVVGVLDDDVVKFLEERGVAIHTKEIFLTHKGLSHLIRDSKRKRGAGLSEHDILRMPNILREPDAVAVEKKKNRLLLLYCADSDKCENMIKVVVDPSYIEKGNKLTVVKTAGYVKDYNIFKGV